MKGAVGDSAVSSILSDRFGAIIVSVILGLGLAAIFRATCRGEACIVVHGPPRDQIDQHVYRIDDQCFKYTSYAVGCPETETNTVIQSQKTKISND